MATASAVSYQRFQGPEPGAQVTDERMEALFALLTRGGMVKGLTQVTCTLNVGSLSDGAGESDTATVPGAQLGDAVMAGSLSVSVVGMTVTAYVSAANTVTFRVQNESGSATDIASATLRFTVVHLA